MCLLADAADPAWMQQVAAEMKHSETAFVRPVDDPEADFELRWFTPNAEVALCGHATMGTAHALFETGIAEAGAPIRFRTLKSGVLTVTRDGDGGLSMDFPSCPPEPIDVPGGLAEALGVPVSAAGRNVQNDVLAEVGDEAAVRGLPPTPRRSAARRPRCDRHRGGRSRAGARLHVPVLRRPPPARRRRGPGDRLRALRPRALLGGAPGRDTMTGYQASERGGHVRVALRGDRVILSGRAVTVLDGTLTA